MPLDAGNASRTLIPTVHISILEYKSPTLMALFRQANSEIDGTISMDNVAVGQEPISSPGAKSEVHDNALDGKKAGHHEEIDALEVERQLRRAALELIQQILELSQGNKVRDLYMQSR